MPPPPPPNQLTLPFASAPAAILRLAHTSPAPRVIAIAGPVGAGKSTLAAALGTCIISTDAYLPDYDKVEAHLRDEPDFADLERLLADLTQLRDRRPAAIPVWCFHQHRRTGERTVHPADLIIIEGLHALHTTHAAAIDLRIYIDAPQATRWSRWEHIERTGQRGMGVEAARTFFNTVAEPTFARRAAKLRASADIIVRNP